MAIEEPTVEKKGVVSPEQQAEMGIEAKKNVRERMRGFIRAQTEKNEISREMMKQYETTRRGTTEGSFRRAVADRLKPVVEANAAATGTMLKAEKGLVKVGGVALEVVGAVTFQPEVALAGALVHKLAGAVEWLPKAQLKFENWKNEMGNKLGKKLGITERVDGIMNRIVGWKEKPMPPKVMAARA